jgi:hypothetical protein
VLSGKPFKPFKYKLPARPPKQPLNRVTATDEGERLTGFVLGKDASDLEERFARALDRADLDYRFQWEVLGPATVPGQENQIDFLVEGVWPTEVDGMFVHKSAAKKAHDAMRDAILNDYLSGGGMYPIRRVPGDRLEDQAGADATVEEMFYGR